MPEIWTLGHPSKRTRFRYTGSIETGVTLVQTGKPRIGPTFFQAALQTFQGREIKGGFKEDDPPRGGFGEWIQQNSGKINGRLLSPRHASFIAAILCHEASVRSRLDGLTVWLRFP